MPGALEHRIGARTTGGGHSSLRRWSAQDSIWRMSLSGSFQVQEAHIELLRNRWHALTAKHSDDESAREAGFRSIVQHYSEPKRAYHNLSHIKALIALHDELKSEGDPDAISFAIWYHDVIYDTRRQDNEERSATLACTSLGYLCVAADTIAEVEKMIKATKNHRAEYLSVDGELFLDLDISILGAPAGLYREYSRAIRQEYDWVPRPMYRSGRSRILNDFLQRRRIFFTEQMNAKFEDQARRNLEDELKDFAGEFEPE